VTGRPDVAEFDYVIVGAGSAGCVLANRLSADPAVRVAVLEAGGGDRHPYVVMPRGVAKLVKMPAFMWVYLTKPEPQTAMRPDYWLRGRGLGGSSSVNGMVWVRGQPADFDQLAQATSDDWSWRHIGRAYEEIERHELGAAPWRGGDGPLRISRPSFSNALTKAILQAGAGMGWPVKEDVNAPDAGDGIGHMPCTIWRGRRQSAALAFLKPAMKRPNLTVFTRAVADSVSFDGKRARGVVMLRDGRRSELRARREVILCAGAVASPGVLERSGVGDPARLEALGIPLVHANPAVGEHVAEHRALRMQWRLKRPLSLNRAYAGGRLMLSVLRYYLTRGGPMAHAAIDMRAAFRSRSGLERPDIQAQIGLYSWDLAGGAGGLERAHGFCAVVNPLRPASRGSIHIAARDPQVPPVIETNYGSANEDTAVTLAAARLLRAFAAQSPLSELIEAETAPGPAAQSDEAILAALHAQGVAGMHTVGSCRMGKDAGSVVDPQLRVRGVEGLRVMDASVFPAIPSGNTNAPVLAMAWRAAEIILGGR
jgi:choline dehydrogenase-like flavoprotein